MSIDTSIDRLKLFDLKLIRDNEFKTKKEEQIGRECYGIAHANNFHDTEEAFVGHIFGREGFQSFFLTDKKENIRGFTVIEFTKLQEVLLGYFSIVFLHPDFHGKGLSKDLMFQALERSDKNPEIIALRTQNGTMRESFAKTFGNIEDEDTIKTPDDLIFDSGLYFPNPGMQTPKSILELVSGLDCAKNTRGELALAKHELFVPGAYPNKFVCGQYRNDFTNDLVSGLKRVDAMIAVVIRDPEWAKSLKIGAKPRSDENGSKRIIS